MLTHLSILIIIVAVPSVVLITFILILTKRRKQVSKKLDAQFCRESIKGKKDFFEKRFQKKYTSIEKVANEIVLNFLKGVPSYEYICNYEHCLPYYSYDHFNSLVKRLSEEFRSRGFQVEEVNNDYRAKIKWEEYEESEKDPS